MKKLIGIITLLYLSFVSYHMQGQNSRTGIDLMIKADEFQNDTIVLSNLRKLDKKYFIAKEVREFLDKETVSCYIKRNFITEPPNRLAYLLLSYGSDVVIEIIPEELKFQKSFSRTNSWDFELFKKERIAMIRLLYKGKVVETVE